MVLRQGLIIMAVGIACACSAPSRFRELSQVYSIASVPPNLPGFCSSLLLLAAVALAVLFFRRGVQAKVDPVAAIKCL